MNRDRKSVVQSVKFSLKNRHKKGINHTLMIYAFFDVLKIRRKNFCSES